MRNTVNTTLLPIDPEVVPKRQTYNGLSIPAVGLGTFGSDHISASQVAQAVSDAIKLGYRHINCAAVYSNEGEVGKSIAQSIQSGTVKRDELWITSKLWNDKHSPKDVVAACEKSLSDLQLDYLDLYLIHWPFPNYHPPGCDVDSRSPNAKPYIHEAYMETWEQLEKLVEQGKVRSIGTSNMTIPKMDLLLRDAKIRPVSNEMELHPHFQQPEFYHYLVKNDVLPIGFCPIGSPARPERDRTPDDTSPTSDPVVVEIAEKHQMHPATLCVKWALQRGQIPIPFSTNPRNFHANLLASTSRFLSLEEMAQLSKIDRNCRLIKGQVFLWKED